MRLISEECISLLKGATDACYRLGNGVTSFALLTRVGVSTLVKYATMGARRDDGTYEYAQTMIPIDIAIEADKRAGSPIILTEVARQEGYGLIALNGVVQPRPITEVDAHSVLAETMDVSKAILDARRDGRIDGLEEKIILREAREAIRALEQVIAGIGEGR